MSRSLVIRSETFWLGSVAKRTSRLVRMPTSLPAFPLVAPSTTGMPEMPFSFISAKASASVASGAMVSGFTTMPDSNFLTWRTWAACSSGSMLRWITPMPPACAIAIAMRTSVTVSMAEAMIGILRRDAAGDAGADIDLGRQHTGQARLQQHVVEGQRLAGGAVHASAEWGLPLPYLATDSGACKAPGFAVGKGG